LNKRSISKIVEKCKNVKLVITDVDGVLTDGSMYYSDQGEVLKRFNTHDGMGVELLLRNNIRTILMTREKSIIAKKRGKKINAAITYTNIKNKKEQLEKICRLFNVNEEHIAYIGDDLNDYEIMKSVGFCAAPANGVKQIKSIADYVCQLSGGSGAFREVADLILSVKNIETN